MSVTMNTDAFITKGFTISTDKNLLDIDVIYNYLDSESYWAKGIPLTKVKSAIENSICFGVYHNSKQIGFARVITDKATFAYLADVFIVEEYRRQGLSKWLVQTIMDNDDLQGLRRWALATMDAHGLYGQFGFEPLQKPDHWMSIYTPYTIG
ncbi:MAG: N-acetyltransferase [Sphingobacteriaceae bacterium]|nr:MAG: N-acetyltransferase [Sphingobacteriaceae bacterium]